MKKTVAFLLTAVIALGMCGCGRISSDKVDDLIDEGYVIEQVDNNSICIIEDGVEYYYKTGLLKPVLSRVVTHVSQKPESPKEYTVTVKIVPELFRIRMYAERSGTYTLANGKEYDSVEIFTFEFKNDYKNEFAWENLSTRGFHDTTSDYIWFTENCFTPEELQEMYDRALELEKEL